MTWETRPAADEDLIRGRKWIEKDNPEAAQQFLKGARECFDRLGQFRHADNQRVGTAQR